MKIKTLGIYGFGKWVNQKFRTGVETTPTHYGKNEAGRVTPTILYPPAVSLVSQPSMGQLQQNRYEPGNT